MHAMQCSVRVCVCVCVTCVYVNKGTHGACACCKYVLLPQQLDFASPLLKRVSRKNERHGCTVHCVRMHPIYLPDVKL